MKAVKTICIVRFTSTGKASSATEKWSSISNTYAIIGDKKTKIAESIEKYRKQEQQCIQNRNSICEVATIAKMIKKYNVVMLLNP
jgi:hypothetical protein